MSSKDIRSEALPRLEQPWSDKDLRAALPLPSKDANKYSRGVLTVIAGSRRYPGAACLASRAAQRMGAGYTEVVTHKTAARLVLGAYPSLVVHDVKEFDPSRFSQIKEGTPRAICIGPGFEPGNARSDQLLVDVLKQAACPVLVDGGGLGALNSKKAAKALAERQSEGFVTVVTPHAGEAKRMGDYLHIAFDDASQLSAVLAMATGAIVVMKGPDTFISNGMRVYPMYEGTPALAKAGTGDVLAGMIAALLAQGVEPIDAAVLGATLHARAGVCAAQTFTDMGVTPEDVIESIPAAIRTLVDDGAVGA